MPTPRVSIDDLPSKATPETDDVLVIQDSGVTKKTTIGGALSLPSSSLTAHLATATDAHDASAVSATDSGNGVNGATVQVQLGQLSALAAAGGGGGGSGGPVVDGDKGDIVVSGSGAIWVLDPTVVTTAAKTVLDDTTTAAMLATLGAATNAPFTTSAPGIVPTPGGTSTGRFLKDDGTWAMTPAGSSGVSGVFPFTYNTSILESITGNQLRGNNATFINSTKLWVSETTADGLDVAVGLGRIKAGFQVYIQDYTSSARYVLFNVTANSIDKGTYWEIPVAWVSSAGTIPGGKVALQSLSSAQASNLFSTTTTAPGLAPGANGATASFLRGDGTWATVSGGSGGGIVQQPTAPADTTVLWADTSQVGIEENVRYLSNVTGTTYTLVLADRGKLLLCSNAAAQTVTVPTNATAAFVVGTQLDLVQMGAGALTIAAAGGVTVNATPSLGFRAQYSAASLIKTATNSWILIGDLL